MQIIVHFVVWTFLTLVGEVTHTGGDIKDAFFCCDNRVEDVSENNIDIIPNEDSDVKGEREKVALMSSNDYANVSIQKMSS